MELLEFTLSFKFLEKWKERFSERMIELFRVKILSSFKNQKPIKLAVLRNFLTNKGRYTEEIVNDFFEAIEIENYYPFIS